MADYLSVEVGFDEFEGGRVGGGGGGGGVEGRRMYREGGIIEIATRYYYTHTSFSVSVGEDGVIRVWDLGSGGILRECWPSLPSNASARQITSLAFSPDGTLLASSDYSKEVKLWNVRTLSIPSQNSTQSSR